MKILDFIFAARPMLQIPVWTIYLLSLRAFGRGHLVLSDFLLIAALSLNAAGAYYINQIYDYHSDLINEKVGFLQKGMISKKSMAVVAVIVLAISFVLAMWINIWAGLVNLVLIILGLLYSMSPARLKDRPVLGLLANSIGFGILIPLVAAFATRTITESTLWLCLFFLLTVGAAHLMTIIPDRVGDIAAGKKTLAFYLSDKKIIYLASIFMLLALLPSILMANIFFIIICVSTFILLMAAISVDQSRVLLFACKFPILLLSLLAGYYYPIYFIFLVVILVSTRLYYIRRHKIVYPKIS